MAERSSESNLDYTAVQSIEAVRLIPSYLYLEIDQTIQEIGSFRKVLPGGVV